MAQLIFPVCISVLYHFSDMAVKLLISSSIFNPALLPSEQEEGLSQYGKEEIKALAQFYGIKILCPMIVRPILPILFIGSYSKEHGAGNSITNERKEYYIKHK